MNALAIALRTQAVELIRSTGNSSVTADNIASNPTWRAQYRDMLADLRRRVSDDPAKYGIIDGMIAEIDEAAAREAAPEAGRKIDVSAIGFQKLTLHMPSEGRTVAESIPVHLKDGIVKHGEPDDDRR